MNNQQFFDGLKLFWPLIALQLGVQIYAIVDIVKRKKTRNLSAPIWIVIIILTELLGPVLYFIFGRAKK